MLPANVARFSDRLDKAVKEVIYLSGQRSELITRVDQLEKRVSGLEVERELLSEARTLLQKVSTIMRMQISERFAELATSALRFIFQRDDLTFIVELDIKGNLPIASFFVEVDGNKVDPRNALGGSVYEVIGVCLRLVCLEFFKLQGPLILDEPLRAVDGENLKSALKFIAQYCKTTGRQLFIVTHNQLIADVADQLFEVTQHNGVSTVKVLTP